MPHDVINFGPILCSACDLCEQAQHPGLPTRNLSVRPPPATNGWSSIPPIPIGGHNKALVVVGMAPGRDEDTVGMSWIGWSGRFLYRTLVDSFGFHKLADIYLTNACRCYVPPGEKLRRGQLSACRPHLLRDLQTLVQRYGPDNVVILALGGDAVRTLTGMSIKQATIYQGVPRVVNDATELPPLPVFVSYHPAMFLPGRDPARVVVYNTHLQLLYDYFTKPRKTVTPPPPMINATPQQVGRPEVVSLDIETYGMLRAHEQTVFHPSRSISVDNIPLEKQILCVSLAWEVDGEMQTAFYNLQSVEHRQTFISVLQNCIRPDFTLLGMNLSFDLTYLRTCVPELRLLIKPYSYKLDDISVLNHLHSDLRPERSLKALATLFSLADYSSLLVSTLPTGSKATGPGDPNLIYYNSLDAVVTLQIYIKMTDELHERWTSLPLSDSIRAKFRSDLLWTAQHMTEYGIVFDRDALQSRHVAIADEQDRAFATARKAGYIIGGTGCVASTVTLLTRSLQAAGLLNDRRVEFTKKRKQVSTKKENYNLALAELPLDNPVRPALQALKDYRSAANEISSYTTPLLTQPTKGCGVTGRAYPSWYATPSFIKDDSGDEGGTRQARFSAHHPAAQTFPATIKSCLVSRYPHGILTEYDLSQIELRVPALLAGDPVMLDTFRKGGDIHDETTATLSAAGLTADTPYDLRQVGKRLNFLMLYRGGAFKFVVVCRQQLGIEITLDFAKTGIAAYWAKYHVLRAWQDALIKEVQRTGVVRVASGWQRTFVKDAFAIEKTYINEICNCPIQTTAAQVFQSAHADILKARETSGLTFIASLQNHDALILDTPPDQFTRVDALIRPILQRPPWWLKLQEIYGREVPIEYSVKRLSP